MLSKHWCLGGFSTDEQAATVQHPTSARALLLYEPTNTHTLKREYKYAAGCISAPTHRKSIVDKICTEYTHFKIVIPLERNMNMMREVMTILEGYCGWLSAGSLTSA